MFQRLVQARKYAFFVTARLGRSEGSRSRPARLRCWARSGAYVALLILAGVALILVLVLDTEPSVALAAVPPGQVLSRTRSLIHGTVRSTVADPHRKEVALTAEDLAAAANFLLLRKKLDGRAVCTIERNRLKLEVSIRVWESRPPVFLNIRLIADDGDPQAAIKRFRLGRLSVPPTLVYGLAAATLRLTALGRVGRVGERLIQDVHVQEGRLTVGLNWNRELLDRAEDLVTDLADRERFAAYRDKLAETVGHSGLKRFIRLESLVQPLFALARSRSDQDNDPVAENRALILILGAYVNGKDLAAGLPSATPEQRGVLLNKRVDTARHFMAAAALALGGQGTLVDMIGLAKEMNDTHDGSGFSFTDLAADQAGALFGKTAVRSVEKAQRVQLLLAERADEALFMPRVTDLPENLSPEEFQARFTDIHSPEFQTMKSEIEARIQSCPIYRLQ